MLTEAPPKSKRRLIEAAREARAERDAAKKELAQASGGQLFSRPDVALEETLSNLRTERDVARAQVAELKKEAEQSTEEIAELKKKVKELESVAAHELRLLRAEKKAEDEPLDPSESSFPKQTEEASAGDKRQREEDESLTGDNAHLFKSSDTDEEYEVEFIRGAKRSGRGYVFLTKYAGYEKKEWQPPTSFFLKQADGSTIVNEAFRDFVTARRKKFVGLMRRIEGKTAARKKKKKKKVEAKPGIEGARRRQRNPAEELTEGEMLAVSVMMGGL